METSGTPKPPPAMDLRKTEQRSFSPGVLDAIDPRSTSLVREDYVLRTSYHPNIGMQFSAHRNQIPAQRLYRKRTIIEWWQSITTPPSPPAEASFVQRMDALHAQLISIVTLFMLIIFVLFIPGSLVLPNRFVIVADVSMIVVCVIALVLNRQRLPLAAGILLTATFEVALAIVCLTTWPFDELSIQQYELFVLGELLAASLVSYKSVLPVAAVNVLFTLVSLKFQPHTPAFALDLQAQFPAVIVRPAAVQGLVAGVTFFWLWLFHKLVKRADSAEMKAALEAEMSSQKEQEIRMQRRQEAYIKQLVDAYIYAQNNKHVTFNVPELPDDVGEGIRLLVYVVASLQKRYASAQRSEHEANQLRAAIMEGLSQLTQLKPNEPIPQLETKTPIDVLFSELRRREASLLSPDHGDAASPSS